MTSLGQYRVPNGTVTRYEDEFHPAVVAWQWCLPKMLPSLTLSHFVEGVGHLSTSLGRKLHVTLSKLHFEPSFPRVPE